MRRTATSTASQAKKIIIRSVGNRGHKPTTIYSHKLKQLYLKTVSLIDDYFFIFSVFCVLACVVLVFNY